MQEVSRHPAALSRRLFRRGLAGASVAGIFTPGFAERALTSQTEADRVPAGAEMACVRFDAARLPILRRADVIVIGGSLAGVAAALEFARAGRKVVLIEQRSYLGREIAATLRPWIDPGALATGEIPEPFSTTLKSMSMPPSAGEIPLRMDAFKLAQEDLLLATPEEFKDARKCTYYYVDAVSFGAQRLGDPEENPRAPHP